MNLDKISDEKLFQNHSKEEVKHWCQSLHYFYYMRARAGHNCEGDTFAAHFRYEGREDLTNRLNEIGVTLNELPVGSIIFDPFGSYSINDLDKIKYTIPQFDDLEQPKNVEIFGHKVHIWVQANRFEISISGTKSDSAYEVSEEDFKVCQSIEKELDKLSWNKIIDEDIKTHSHCISKEKYPELYLESV